MLKNLKLILDLKMTDLKAYLKSIYDNCVEDIFLSGRSGYWSNLSKVHNKEFLEILKDKDCKSAVNLLCQSLRK